MDMNKIIVVLTSIGSLIILYSTIIGKIDIIVMFGALLLEWTCFACLITKGD